MTRFEPGWVAFWSPTVGDWIFINSPDEGYAVYTAPNPLDRFPDARLQVFVRDGCGALTEVPGVTTAIGEFQTADGRTWRAAVDLCNLGMYTCHVRLVDAE